MNDESENGQRGPKSDAACAEIGWETALSYDGGDGLQQGRLSACSLHGSVITAITLFAKKRCMF